MKDSFFPTVIARIGSPSNETKRLLLWFAEAIRDGQDVLDPRESMELDILLAAAVRRSQELQDLHCEAYHRISSPIGLRTKLFARLPREANVIDHYTLGLEVIIDARAAAEITANGKAHEMLTALVDEMKAEHPNLHLSFGYIGNCSLGGQGHDDRNWYVFTKLASPAARVGCDVSFGGYATNRLGRFHAHAARELSAWCRTQQARLDDHEIRSLAA